MHRDKDKNMSVAAGLRSAAEKQLHANAPVAGFPQTDDEKQLLLHELQVHQIEVEMQNAELRQTRDEMELTLVKYTDLYDFAPVGYFTLDCDGFIGTANLSAAGLLGVARSLLPGRRFGQFISANYRTFFSAFLARVFTRKDKESCELELLNDRKQPFFVQIEAMADVTGEGCRIAIIDISERRQLEEKLEILHTDLAARSVELEAANIELEAFNHSVSHDLRSPLTFINSYCQVIQEMCCSKQNDECSGYVQDIYAATLRMNRLIETLLDFSRILRVEMHLETIDLSEMAMVAAAELELAEPENQVTFRIAPGITCKGDADLWRIVLNNLLGNAWKHGGSRAGKVIEFGLTAVEGKPACFVRDNGPGFDMAFANKLFIPFQRLPGTNNAGHGLGLAMVRRIISRHGGLVWAESNPGEGATFLFTLEPPVSDKQPIREEHQL